MDPMGIVHGSMLGWNPSRLGAKTCPEFFKKGSGEVPTLFWGNCFTGAICERKRSFTAPRANCMLFPRKFPGVLRFLIFETHKKGQPFPISTSFYPQFQDFRSGVLRREHFRWLDLDSGNSLEKGWLGMISHLENGLVSDDRQMVGAVTLKPDTLFDIHETMFRTFNKTLEVATVFFCEFRSSLVCSLCYSLGLMI